jgi:hypothetical protein
MRIDHAHDHEPALNHRQTVAICKHFLMLLATSVIYLSPRSSLMHYHRGRSAPCLLAQQGGFRE